MCELEAGPDGHSYKILNSLRAGTRAFEKFRAEGICLFG